MGKERTDLKLLYSLRTGGKAQLIKSCHTSLRTRVQHPKPNQVKILSVVVQACSPSLGGEAGGALHSNRPIELASSKLGSNLVS